MNIDSSEARRLALDLSQAPAEVRAKAPIAIRKTLFDIEGTSQILVARDTSDLANSISTDVDADGMGGEVGPTVNYGDDVEYGTQPHVIRAKNGGKLVFMGRDGRLVFVDKVDHPGTPPQPYMGPSFDRHVPGLERQLGDVGEGVL